MNGKSVKYQYYDSNKRSFLTIPRAMAEGLNWINGDEIGIINVNINGQEGLFLTKKDYKRFKIIEKEI
ncbi:hypothetical protein ES705_12687 [subsurface metagenome]